MLVCLMKRFFVCLFSLILSLSSFFVICCNRDVKETNGEKRISADIPVEVYSSAGKYVAFCDAVKFEGKYYCVFREGENHAPLHEWHQNGYLKILSSSNLIDWAEELVIKDDKWDLRDPCFCLVERELYLYCGLYSFAQPAPNYKTRITKLTSVEGKLHVVDSEKVDIGEYSNHWLWKVYYNGGLFYGTTYFEDEPVYYVISYDGTHFSIISEVAESGSETSLVELTDETILSITRNVTPKGNSLLSISSSSQSSWNRYELNEMIESPESFIYDNEVYVIGRSKYGMSMFKVDITKKRVYPVYNFFAYGGYGDCGYPGVVVDNNQVIVFYYAVNSTTSETSIYQTNLYYSR